jgi:hypothetical protein
MALGTLLLVPGFMGSQLNTAPTFYGWGPADNVWINYGRLSIGGLHALTLDAAGDHGTDEYAGDLSGGAPVRPYYDGIFDYADKAGWNLVWAPMDWRKVPALDAAVVAAKIVSMADQGPIHIVCHSRGGLVVRLALTLLAGQGQLGLVGRVAGFGVPHTGTLDSAFLLAGWSRPWDWMVQLISRATAHRIGVRAEDQMRRIFTTWPAPYYLLPSPSASWISQVHKTQLYQPTAWTAQGVPISETWLGGASAFWETLPPIPSAVPWLDVLSDAFATPTDYSSEGPPLSSADVVTGLLGDDSVCVESAHVGENLTVTTPATHVGLIHDARVYPYLTRWFTGQLNEPVRITGAICP